MKIKFPSFDGLPRVPEDAPYEAAVLGAFLGAGVAWILVSAFQMDSGVAWVTCTGGALLGMFSPFLALLWARNSTDEGKNEARKL